MADFPCGEGGGEHYNGHLNWTGALKSEHITVTTNGEIHNRTLYEILIYITCYSKSINKKKCDEFVFNLSS